MTGNVRYGLRMPKFLSAHLVPALKVARPHTRHPCTQVEKISVVRRISLTVCSPTTDVFPRVEPAGVFDIRLCYLK